MDIRSERDADAGAIRAVNVAAFDTALEADLVAALRQHARPLVSLVAEDHGAVVGHILFSPVTLDTDPRMAIAGLAPMAVVPARQRQLGLRSEYDVPDEVFMARELVPGALDGKSGVIRYHPAFAGL
jgi:putative acetyltransferase